MRLSTLILNFALASIPHTNAQHSKQDLPAVLTTDFIRSLGNSSLFLRWRPLYHFIAPAGWMNDPCGMTYDPKENQYHMQYQFHPNHVRWGNISWGHAVSKDLITWTDVGGWQDGQAQSLGTGPHPDSRKNSYYGLGIFSGTSQPYNLQGKQDGTLISFYTSVQHLPISWDKPYVTGAEKQAIAISKNGGKTWEQFAGNPIISSPPPNLDVTGWRDPFVEPWPEMDSLLGQPEPHWYMSIGSGKKGNNGGGRIPFYSASSSNLTNWKYLGVLWEPKAGGSLGNVLETGSYGFNFEVVNFFSLADQDGQLHYYTYMGTEGSQVPEHPRDKYGIWNEGTVVKRPDGSPQFTPIAGGNIDSGLTYAVTTFLDTKNKRRIQWGWADEDNNSFGATQAGYAGAYTLPRELYVIKTKHLTNTTGSLTPLGNTRIIKERDGTFTGYTLGSRPPHELVRAIRDTGRKVVLKDVKPNILAGAGSSHMELTVTLSNPTGPAGVIIAASPGGQEKTRLWYDPKAHTINVDRSKSSEIREFASYTVIGYFHPYTYVDGKQEALNLDIFIDGSLIEIHINNRFWLTTRIYPARLDSTSFGMWVENGAKATFSDLTWYNLDRSNAFPNRPRDSSSKLVWDSPTQTGDYKWWDGF